MIIEYYIRKKLLKWLYTILVVGAVAVTFLFIAYENARGIDRCESLKKDVRIEHTKYFGPAFPWWYGVGQLKQESCCRTTVTAFDGGQGVAQFMPKTAQYIMSLMGEKLNPYNTKQAIRMQAFYMARIHQKENWSDRLWVDYQIYNGGAGLLKKEFQRAGSLSWWRMRLECHRKIIKLKSGGLLDLCEVNYDYSQKVYFYGQFYSTGFPDRTMYW